MTITPNLTSSTTGTLYFAYGSNLSPHQMHHRCLDDPETSAVPVAIARADGWKWVICERGYANIVPVPVPAPVPGGGEESETTTTTTVWGVLYNMTRGDEAILDRYEGHDEGRNAVPEVNRDPETVGRTPVLQGNWDYNKWYIDVTVTKWLQPASVLGLDTSTPAAATTRGNDDVVKVLAYVDELRTGEGTILKNYVGRMNRGIEESVALGLPRRWVDMVMRRWVTPGIFPARGYVGTNEGYVVPEKQTESSREKVEEEGVTAQPPHPQPSAELPGA